jgi:hypothetical protein
MKKVLLIVVSLLVFQQVALLAQDADTGTKTSKIGISFSSFGDNPVYRNNEPDGGASYDSDYFYTVGFCYIRKLNNWLEFETGLDYSSHHIVINSMMIPDLPDSHKKAQFGLVNIPVTLRANFLRYFFVNGGLMLDIDASASSPIDSQTGLGALVGVALKYDSKFGVSVFVNPYTKVHSLLPFGDSENHQSVWENGVRIGVTYALK